MPRERVDRVLAPLLPLFALVLLLAVASCGSGADPIKPGDDDDDGGGVQRGSLTLHVVASADFAGAAAALGWSSGVAGAVVTIQRIGEAQKRTRTADGSGHVAWEDLLPGFYTVSVARLLTSAEVGKLSGTAFAKLNAFGGARSVEVKVGGNDAAAEVAGGSRGSLVISELHGSVPIQDVEAYRQGHFVQVYNNTDSTNFLDGKVIGKGMGPLYSSSNWSCAELEQYRLDPDGIWSRWHIAFPGTGRQYPLDPGKSVVVAADAIDHGQFWPGLMDLSEADFETVVPEDIDNPAVPNMIDIGILLWQWVDGHGLVINGIGTHFVADAFDPATLPQADITGPDPRHRRIPREKILDAATVLTTPESIAGFGGTYCSQVAHPNFELGALLEFRSRNIESYTRKVLATLPDGRVILQRTRTSAVDFSVTAPSPFAVP